MCVCGYKLLFFSASFVLIKKFCLRMECYGLLLVLIIDFVSSLPSNDNYLLLRSSNKISSEILKTNTPEDINRNVEENFSSELLLDSTTEINFDSEIISDNADQINEINENSDSDEVDFQLIPVDFASINKNIEQASSETVLSIANKSYFNPNISNDVIIPNPELILENTIKSNNSIKLNSEIIPDNKTQFVAQNLSSRINNISYNADVDAKLFLNDLINLNEEVDKLSSEMVLSTTKIPDTTDVVQNISEQTINDNNELLLSNIIDLNQKFDKLCSQIALSKIYRNYETQKTDDQKLHPTKSEISSGATKISESINKQNSGVFLSSSETTQNANKNLPVGILQILNPASLLRPISEKLTRISNFFTYPYHPNYGGLNFLSPQELLTKLNERNQLFSNNYGGIFNPQNNDYPFAYRANSDATFKAKKFEQEYEKQKTKTHREY